MTHDLRCYIACSYVDRDLYAEIESVVTRLGFKITYRWPDHVPPDGGPERHRHRKEQAVEEQMGVESADVLVVGLQGRYGTATEIGIAIGSGVPVVLFGTLTRDSETGDPVNIFLDHPTVEYVSADADELVCDLVAIGDRILAERMSDLIRAQLSAPYDSWTTAEHRAELARVSEAYDRLHGLVVE